MLQLGLRKKFLIIIIGTILVMALAITIAVQTNLKHRLTLETQKRGEIIAFDISNEAINALLAQNIYALKTLALDHVEADESVEFIFITDPDGEVLAHSFGDSFPAAFRKHDLLKNHQETSARFFKSEKGLISHVISPVLGGGAGVVHVGVNAEPIKKTVNEIIAVIITIIICISFIACLVAGIFVRIITAPVLKLTKIAELVGNGDFQQKADDIPGDEIGRLAISFNQMIDKLRDATEGLEKKIKERTNDLVQINTSLENEIAERKNAEEEKVQLEAQLRQSHKMEAIGTMAGGIAHDFNNILAAVIGYTTLAKDNIPDGNSAQDDLKQVLNASSRAKELVSHILTFSRKSDSANSHVNINPGSIVKEVLKFQRSIIPTTIDIRSDIDENCGHITGDSTEIYQVIMNFCTNALQEMDEIGGTITVSLHNTDHFANELETRPDLRVGNYVRLSISDTGTGIDPKHIDRIFDPYFTTKGVGKGSGMGLAMVHGIVNKHGGFLTVESEPGQGATFNVFFPRVEEECVPVSDDEIMEIPTGSERILFVDDEKDLVKIAESLIGSLGYSVTAVEDSAEALGLFREDPSRFDLVITDQTMPDITGTELSMHLLQIRPDVPIILCTGYSNIINEEKAKEIGIREYIMKPVDKNDIAILIRKVLDNAPGVGPR